MSESIIPRGLCQCGCGTPTPLAKQSDTRRGIVRGQPLRYIKEHAARASRNKPPAVHRFWKYVDQRGPDECWEWTGGLVKGYGHFRVKLTHVQAHRFSYELHHGTIGPGLMICHSCDNPRCVNPAHLWQGTAKENNHDMIAKGRRVVVVPNGESHFRAKLNADDVRAIRRMMAEGTTNKAIAALYPVDVSVISCIRHNKLWKSVR